jgi:starch synthase (maltosyl-transferring)
MGRLTVSPPEACRIYRSSLVSFGKKSGWGAALARISALGFTHILIGEPYHPGARPAHLFRVAAEFDALATLLDDLEARQSLTEFCRAAARQELAVVLDIALERAEPRGALIASLLPWRVPRDAALDPRAADFGQPGVKLPWHDPIASETLLRRFGALLTQAIAAGVAGFRVLATNDVSGAQLAALFAAARRSRSDAPMFLDATGTSTAALGRFKGCHISGVINSFAYWNYHDTWFYLEHERLARIAPVIFETHASAPSRETMTPEERHGARCDALRRLRLASLLGDGLLMHGDVLELDDDEGSLAAALAEDSLVYRNHAHARPLRWLRLLSSPGAAVVVIARHAADGTDLLVALNTAALAKAAAVTDIVAAINAPSSRLALLSLADHDKVEATLSLIEEVRLEGFEVRPMRSLRASQVLAPKHSRASAKEQLKAAIAQSRVVLEGVSPSSDDGRFAAAADLGTLLLVGVDAYCDGHDRIAVVLQWKPCDETQWREVTMQAGVNDRHTAFFPLERLGKHEFRIMAWVDRFASWRSDTEKKRAAGRDLALETLEGLALVSIWAEDAENQDLKELIDALLAAPGSTEQARELQLEILFKPETLALMQMADRRPFAAITPVYPVNAERRAARFASWYELFPRSMSPTPGRHGTLLDVIEHLPRIAAMGFDVLYFPPIHPIGTTHRKGRNNQLLAAPEDPGSPYAIGAADGGHDALHAELGTLADFRALIDAAASHGLEIAVDFAIQCSPDHPWLKEHPAWFQFRADGTVRHAENPPKTYEDIVNVDFYTVRASEAEPEPAITLWQALRDVVLFWIGQGIRIFRVDNPHTKPLPFWQWMIADIRGRHPDVLFLAEAFTRPKMMARLAKVGFVQSYTYFTWRNSRYELTTYLNELNASPLREVYRPHFFVNTPDINPYFLQSSGRAGFLIRAALASLLSGLWGMYSGFEICESQAIPGKEEYLDSEKYELRRRDFNQAGNIVAEITRLNYIRRTNPALASHLGVKFYTLANEAVLFFSKATATRDNVVLAAVCLDPHHAQEFDYELPLWEWGLADDASLAIEDLVDDYKFTLYGKQQRMRLEPWHRPYAIWRVSRQED